MSIHEQLVKIQQGLHVPKDKKAHQFVYRNAESILAAVKPLLGGCTITLNDNIVAVVDRIYCTSTATLSDGEKTISAQAFAREQLNKRGMDEPQVTGASMSYARKYALQGLFAIDSSDTKDADATPAPTMLEQINNCYTRDQMTSLWKQMSPAEQKEHKDEFIERSKQIEAEA